MEQYLNIKLKGYKGKALSTISQAVLAEIADQKHPVKDWNLIRHVSKHGTWTYSIKADLGEGEQEYIIKFVNQAEAYKSDWRKTFSAKGLKKPWRYPKGIIRRLFDNSPPRMGFEKALVLLQQRIATPQPVAYLSKGELIFQKGLIITRKILHLPAGNMAEYFMSRKDQVPEKEYAAEKKAVLKELAGIICCLMKQNFYLPDMRISNVLIQKPPAGNFKLWVIDLVEAIDRKPREETMLFHLIANPIYAKLFDDQDRIQFLKWYLEPLGRENEWPLVCKKVKPRLEKWWSEWYKRNSAKGKKSARD